MDSSVWVDYFSGTEDTEILSELIDNGSVCTNDIILTEIIPILDSKKQNELVSILNILRKLHLNIDWEKIRSFQKQNIKNGINKVPIPDLIILQNVIEHRAEIFTFDKHFSLMAKIFKFHSFSPEFQSPHANITDNP